MSTKATYQDCTRRPATPGGRGVDGTLYLNPRPASRAAWASTGLGEFIEPPFNPGIGGPGGWWIVDGPELHLGEDILVPDLANWHREQMPAYPM